MPVIFSSFKNFRHLGKYLGFRPRAYSVARYQPRGSRFPELDFLAPPSGLRLTHGTFEEFLAQYEQVLKEAYSEGWADIRRWLFALPAEEPVALLCWCPDTDLAREQLKTFGVFACHTGLIGKMLNRHRPDIEIWLDTDRARLAPAWKPEHTRVIGRSPMKQKTLFNFKGGETWKSRSANSAI